MIHKTNSQNETHKKIHNMIHKNDSQNDSHKIHSQLKKCFKELNLSIRCPPPLLANTEKYTPILFQYYIYWNQSLAIIFWF